VYSKCHPYVWDCYNLHEFWLQTILKHKGQEGRSTCTSNIHDLQQTTMRPLAQKLKCWYTGTVTRSQQLQWAAVPRGLSHPLLWLTSDGYDANAAHTHTHLLATLQSLHNSSADTQTALEVPVWCPEHRKSHRCWLCYQATVLKDTVTATAPLATPEQTSFWNWWDGHSYGRTSDAKFLFPWIWITCFSINIDYMLSVSIWIISCQ